MTCMTLIMNSSVEPVIQKGGKLITEDHNIEEQLRGYKTMKKEVNQETQNELVSWDYLAKLWESLKISSSF